MKSIGNPDPTLRFNQRAHDYARHRAGYPAEIVDYLKKHFDFDSSWTVADIGVGTGKLAELFLNAGCRVRGVEPNDEMRRAAEEPLSGFSQFDITNGRAEATGLPAQSIDLITAGQAFHWFDVAAFRAEARRVLRPGGVAALIWNNRRLSSPFAKAYEEFLLKHFPDYSPKRHSYPNLSIFEQFFGGRDFQIAVFDNPQPHDFESVVGLISSTSYAPVDWREKEELMNEIGMIFETHQRYGHVVLEYNTKMFCGRVI